MSFNKTIINTSEIINSADSENATKAEYPMRKVFKVRAPVYLSKTKESPLPEDIDETFSEAEVLWKIEPRKPRFFKVRCEPNQCNPTKARFHISVRPPCEMNKEVGNNRVLTVYDVSPINSKIGALNNQRKKLYVEMQASYFEANPSAEGMDVEEIRKLSNEGKMPPFPTYAQALQEHIRRRREKDQEHDPKLTEAEARKELERRRSPKNL
jgi:hypothetical protein